MFCEKCGKPFEGEGSVCSECAAKQTEDTVNVEAPVAAEVVTPPAETSPAPESVAATEEPLVLGEPVVAKKKSRKGLIAGIVAAVLALSVGAYFLFFQGDSSNTPVVSATEVGTQSVQQPENYLDNVTDLYGDIINSTDYTSSTTEIRIQVDQNLLTLLSSNPNMAMDLTWLQNTTITIDRNLVDDILRRKLDISLNGTQIITVDTISSPENASTYVGFPELNNQYLLIPVSDQANFLSQLTTLRTLKGDLPSEDVLNDLAQRYLTLVLAEITDIAESEEDVTISGVTEKQKVQTITLTEADLLRIEKVLVENFASDPDIEVIYDVYSEYLNSLYGDYLLEKFDLYRDLVENLSETLEYLDEEIANAADDAYITVKLYTGADGNLAGCSATIVDASYETSLSLQTVKANGVTYLQYTVDDSQIIGQWETTGDTTVGQFQLLAIGDTEAFCTFDLSCTKGGQTEICMTPGADMLSNLLDSIAPNASLGALGDALAGSVALKATISEISKEQISAAFELTWNNSTLVTVSVSVKPKDPEEIHIPGDTVEYSNMIALEQWAKNLSIDKVLDNLRQAGVPEALLTELEAAFDQLFVSEDIAEEAIEETVPVNIT